MTSKTYSLCEAVADIAYAAGSKGFTTEDSRGTIALFIQWAVEFEQLNEGVKWGEGLDYIESIDDFIEGKMTCPLHILLDKSFLISKLP